jgi:molybdenum cofactor cytidylyltransferase
MFPALLLSGGASTRLGGEPKGCLDIGGEPAIHRMARLCTDAGFSPIVAVVGLHAHRLTSALAGMPVGVVVNEGWEAGRTGSIQRGLELLGTERPTLVWPVDFPFVEPTTLLTLLDESEHDALGVFFIPTHGGRGGHPVLMRGVALTDTLELRPDAPLRSLFPELGPQVARVAVDDPGVVEKVDTMDDYLRGHLAWLERGMRF